MLTRAETRTGGRQATTRHIPPKLALAVGMPLTPAPKNWRWVPLTSIARMESGHTPSRRHPEYWGGNVPWISLADAKLHHGDTISDTIETTNDLGIANSSARVLPVGTVCLSRTASVGYVLVMGRPMATSQDFVNWICSKEVDPEFLQYLFLSEGDDLLRFASGAVHSTIYFPEAKAFHVCIPDVSEQKRIVRILDEAFESIATAKANAEKNLANARAVFESYLQSVFSQRGKGWVLNKLRSITTKIGSGATPRGGEGSYKTAGVSLIRSLNVHDLGFKYAKLAFLDDAQADELSNVEVRPRDVLLNITGASVARCTIVPDDVLPARVNQHVSIIRPVPEKLDSDFLHYLLISKNYKDQLLKTGEEGGSTRQAITKAQLQEFTVEYPPRLTEQKMIVSKLNAMVGETRQFERIYAQKLRALDALKRSLLREAFSGRL